MLCQYFLLQQPSRASHFGRSKAFLTFKQNILIYRQIGSEGSRLWDGGMKAERFLWCAPRSNARTPATEQREQDETGELWCSPSQGLCGSHRELWREESPLEALLTMIGCGAPSGCYHRRGLWPLARQLPSASCLPPTLQGLGERVPGPEQWDTLRGSSLDYNTCHYGCKHSSRRKTLYQIMPCISLQSKWYPSW